MEITRKVDLSIATHRRYVIRQSDVDAGTPCLVCGAPMLTPENAARMFGITQRHIFRMIEADTIHATELVNRTVMICLPSLSQTVEREARPE